MAKPTTILGFILAIIFIAFLIWIVPAIALWAINNLVVAYGGTAIHITFKIWGSMALLILIFAGSGNCK